MISNHSIQSYRFYELTSLCLYRILRLRCDVFVVEQNCAYPEVDDIDLDALHVCIWQDQTLLAYSRIYQKHQKWYIGRVVVANSVRGQGMGHILMQESLKLIPESCSVHLSAQSHLQSFYATHGFVSVGECYLEDGIEHIAMEKK